VDRVSATPRVDNAGDTPAISEITDF
jgi:hypothetical protein